MSGISVVTAFNIDKNSIYLGFYENEWVKLWDCLKCVWKRLKIFSNFSVAALHIIYANRKLFSKWLSQVICTEMLNYWEWILVSQPPGLWHCTNIKKKKSLCNIWIICSLLSITFETCPLQCEILESLITFRSSPFLRCPLLLHFFSFSFFFPILKFRILELGWYNTENLLCFNNNNGILEC